VVNRLIKSTIITPGETCFLLRLAFFVRHTRHKTNITQYTYKPSNSQSTMTSHVAYDTNSAPSPGALRTILDDDIPNFDCMIADDFFPSLESEPKTNGRQSLTDFFQEHEKQQKITVITAKREKSGTNTVADLFGSDMRFKNKTSQEKKTKPSTPSSKQPSRHSVNSASWDSPRPSASSSLDFEDQDIDRLHSSCPAVVFNLHGPSPFECDTSAASSTEHTEATAQSSRSRNSAPCQLLRLPPSRRDMTTKKKRESPRCAAEILNVETTIEEPPESGRRQCRKSHLRHSTGRRRSLEPASRRRSSLRAKSAERSSRQRRSSLKHREEQEVEEAVNHNITYEFQKMFVVPDQVRPSKSNHQRTSSKTKTPETSTSSHSERGSEDSKSHHRRHRLLNDCHHHQTKSLVAAAANTAALPQVPGHRNPGRVWEKRMAARQSLLHVGHESAGTLSTSDETYTSGSPSLLDE